MLDVQQGKRLKTINGLKEPQGVLYVPDNDRLYVANGKDRSVEIFDGTSYALLKTIKYGDDADNLRYDSVRHRVYVGYGGGAIGEIDNRGEKVGEVKLDPPRVIPAGQRGQPHLSQPSQVPQACRFSIEIKTRS